MKIILSNKARNHMEAHKSDFIYNWEGLIKQCEEQGKLYNLCKQFEKVKVEFPIPIGYCNLVETNDNDDIVFAKRIGRDTYTRFVKNREARLVRSVILILNQNRNNLNEYYLVTMFPGEESYKEPEDLNIISRNELMDCLYFWDKHALIFDESTIDVNTIKDYCPYKNMYLAIAG